MAELLSDWHYIETAREQWLEAAELEDIVLETLLEVAKQQVIEYAPALEEPAEGAELVIPVNYSYAQLQQAKNLYNAARVTPGGEYGEDTFVIRPHPLDWIIKQILRPRSAVPNVG